MTENQFKPTLIALLAPLCWSTVPLAVHYEKHIAPLLLIALCLFCFVIFEFIRQLITNSLYSLRNIPLSFHLNGILGIVGLHYFYYTALKLGPITPIFLIINLSSILIMLYGKFFLKNIITIRHLVGLTIAFIGVIIISLYKLQGDISNYEAPILSYLLAFAAANCWALYSVLSSKFQDIKVEATLYTCLWSALICLGLFFLTNHEKVIITISDWFLIDYLGLFPVGYAFYFWNYGMRFGDINVISIAAYINPVLAALFLVAFDLEDFSPALILALILVILGSVIACFKKKT